MSLGTQVCIVGAGSSYTPELIEGLIQRPELNVAGIRLQDVNAERLGIMAGLARRMLQRSKRDLKVTDHAELGAALPGADFVVTQIRVGGMAARDLDETLPMKYGIIGQETTGPGGMFKALRTIGPMLEIAREVEKHAPSAFILNYTNPSGIITEALCRHSRAKTIGLCSGIPGIQDEIKRRLKDEYPGLKCYSAGLNHLGFIYKFLCEGRDVTAAVLQRLGEQAPGYHLAQTLGAVPIGYVDYFFRRGHKLKAAQEEPQNRAKQIMEIEREIFRQAADPGLAQRPPALAARGGGGYADVTFAFMQAIQGDARDELVCSVANGASVDGIDPPASVEVTCQVGAQGAVPLPLGPLPLAFRGLVQAVKAYESLTVEAALKKEKKLVVQALLNHPLCEDLDLIEPMVDEMLKAHGLEYR